MLCCSECFNSPTLKKYINQKGKTGNCDFCKSRSIRCIEPSELYDLFLPILGLYRPIKCGRDYFKGEDPFYHGYFLYELLEYDWLIFSDLFDPNKNREFWKKLQEKRNSHQPAIYVAKENHSPTDLYVPIEGNLINRWRKLTRHIKYERRFILDNSIQKEAYALLAPVLEYSRSAISEGQTYYRARIGHISKGVFVNPYRCRDMKMPPPRKANVGRANPPGIPCLYLSTDEPTAVAEVRPWVGAYVSVAKWSTVREIVVVDFTKPKRITDPFESQNSVTFFL